MIPLIETPAQVHGLFPTYSVEFIGMQRINLVTSSKGP